MTDRIKFSEIPYERVMLDDIKTAYAGFAREIKAASSFEQAREAYLRFDAFADHVDTLAELAFIRHKLNTSDEFYKAENRYYGETFFPGLSENQREVCQAVLEGAYAGKFEQVYGPTFTVRLMDVIAVSDPEIAEERAAESALCSDYEELVSAIRIDWNGEPLTGHAMSPYLFTDDDDIRLAAWKKSGEGYLSVGGELDRIFDELVKVRTGAAKKLGCDNFVPLGYKRMKRDWFSWADLDGFRQGIKEYIVPLVSGFKKAQAERLGKDYPMNFADNTLTFRSEAVPIGTKEDTLNTAFAVFKELSPETAAFIEYLSAGGMFDVSASPTKSGGGFSVFLPDYKSPFLFSHFTGTLVDVNSITHEGGHAFAGYMARNIRPSVLRAAALDTAEIHAQAMELFLLPYAERFFGKDSLKYVYEHITDAYSFIPYGVMVDEFQQRVYENPRLSPDERHGLWRELLSAYMPWLKPGEIPFYGDGRHWQRQMHIYVKPFYYIDYVLSNIAALQFWAESRDDFPGAWRRYLELVKLGGQKNFLELLQAASLPSPLLKESLLKIGTAADEWLSSVCYA